METELEISRGGFPPLSARGCKQELIPLTLGSFHRTIQQKLVFVGEETKKYKTIISCKDQSALATDGLYPGAVVTVACIQNLWQKINGTSCVLDKQPVPGSVEGIVLSKDSIAPESITDRTVTFKESIEGFVRYRPLLTMRVVNYTLMTDEWQIAVGWTLEMEEI